MMNSNNTTSNNLKMNTMRLSFGYLLQRPSFWLALVLTVVGFSLLINLGLWQLSRAEEKVQLEQALSARENVSPISLDAVSSLGEPYLTGVYVEANLVPQAGKYLLLDNQTYLGQVGYLAYQLVTSEQQQSLLLERGFIAHKGSRTELPQVSWLDESMEITGRLYQRSLNPLSHDLMPEFGLSAIRVQNVNIEQLEQLWEQDIAPYILQPQLGEWPYPQPWQPLPMASAKHYGYAVQWFAMAAALLALSCWVFYRSLRQGEAND